MNVIALVASGFIWLFGLVLFLVSAWFERAPKRSIALAAFWAIGLLIVCVGSGLTARYFTLGMIELNPFWGTNDILALSFRVLVLLGLFYASFPAAQLACNIGRGIIGLPRRKLTWLPPSKSGKG